MLWPIRSTVSCAALVAVLAPCGWAKRPHYTFVLPDGYVGWVQVIFGDPQAPGLPFREDKGYEIDVPESGIARTSDWRVHASKVKDEFYYRSNLPDRPTELRPVPSAFVLPGDSHGGFGVMDTGGKGRGYSWFVFVGPPSVRAEVPKADWDKVVDEYAKAHGGSMRVEWDGKYPQPGRMIQGSP